MSGIGRLELKQLRILRGLLRERNVSRVASQIGLTQQAVSEQLKKLRHVFDDRLFVRTSNGLVPTPVAEQLQDKVEKILVDVENLLEPPEFCPATVNKIYTISATDYAQIVVMPRLLPKILKHAPNLKIVLRDFEIDQISAQMVTGEVDMALTFPDFISDSLPCMPLFTEHHICVAATGSPLAGRTLSLADIASIPQIITSPSRANLRGSADALFESEALSRNVVMSAPCFSLVPKYIEATKAIAFIPSRSMPDQGLVKLDLAAEPMEFDVIAAWHARSNSDDLHNWILGLFKEEFDR